VCTVSGVLASAGAGPGVSAVSPDGRYSEIKLHALVNMAAIINMLSNTLVLKLLIGILIIRFYIR